MNSGSSLRIKLLLASLITLVVVADAGAQAKLEKITLQGSKPLPRSGHGMVNVDGKILLFGGFNGNLPATHISAAEDITTQQFFGDMWEFLPGGNQFKEMMPQNAVPIKLFTSVAVQGKPLVFFGITNRGLNNKELEFLLPDNFWREKDDRNPEKPPHREGADKVVLDGEVFIIGGRSTETGLRLNDFWVYTPDIGWTQLEDLPEDFLSHNATVKDGEIYVTGGVQMGTKVVDITYGYDMEDDEWFQISRDRDSSGVSPQADEPPDSLTARRFAAKAQIGNALYLFGGVLNSKMRDDIVKITFNDDDTFTVEQLAVKFPAPIIEASAVVIKQTPATGVTTSSLQTVEILIFGGFKPPAGDTDDAFIFTDTVEVAAPPPDECVGGPTVASVVVGNKLKIKGNGFLQGPSSFSVKIDEVGFIKAPIVEGKRVIQKGLLTNGKTIAEACANGCNLKINNGDGRCTKTTASAAAP